MLKYDATMAHMFIIYTFLSMFGLNGLALFINGSNALAGPYKVHRPRVRKPSLNGGGCKKVVLNFDKSVDT